jgi:glycosyltransferase involved in cell wall biosynthesis
VARYTRQKRLDDILAAAARLKSEGIDLRIVMVGEGPTEDELKETVRSKGLDETVEFVPLVAQQKLGELYRRSDIVILSSEGEGFGLVLVEAGLTGRPVIGTRSGGITDIVNDGENGLLYEVGDTDALAACIRTLVTDPGKRHELGEGGYRRATEHFSTPVLVDRVYKLFMSMIPDNRRP